MEDREWNEWTSAFRSERRALDHSGFRRRLRRSSLLQALETLLTLVACLGASGLVVGRAAANPHPAKAAIAAAVVVFLAVSLWVFFRVRRGAWRAALETPRGLLALLRRREEARLREGRFALRSMIVLGSAVALWLPWKLWVDWAGYSREPWRAIVGIGGVAVLLAVSWIATRRWTRVKARSIAELVELERSYENGGSGGGS